MTLLSLLFAPRTVQLKKINFSRGYTYPELPYGRVRLFSGPIFSLWLHAGCNPRLRGYIANPCTTAGCVLSCHC